MEKFSIKHLAWSLLFVFLLISCGGSSSNSNPIIVLGEGYQEKPGDEFTKTESNEFNYSNGQTNVTSSEIVESYSQVAEIPASYGYSNAIPGPYLLKTTTKNGEISDLEYMSATGDTIIDDDLETFSNIESTTETGSDEPENIRIGDKFNYSLSSTLFNSQTGDEVGEEIISMKFTVVDTESITVPAGVFDAIKLTFEASYEYSIENIINSLDVTGNLWVDSTNGFTLKINYEGEANLEGFDVTATTSSESELTNYTLAPTTSGKKMLGKTSKKQNLINATVVKNALLQLKKIRP